MATTIDHLLIHHRVRVCGEFTDLSGLHVAQGETGVFRGISFDLVRREIHFRLERESDCLDLRFTPNDRSGPCKGFMRKYFEMGEYVPPLELVPLTKVLESDDFPEWFREVAALESAEKLSEADQLVRKALPHYGAPMVTADFYEQLMARLKEEGDDAGALFAFHRADWWSFQYASYATSGGEGAALSLERDRFRESLVRRLGFDPAAAGSGEAKPRLP